MEYRGLRYFNFIVILYFLFLFVIASASSDDVIIKGYTSSAIPCPNGNILYVGGSGKGNYSTICDAIKAASDGDTVFVYNGIYHENLEIDKSLSLIGEDKNTTIIDGSNSGDVVHISASNVLINGFTIQNSGRREDDAGIEIISDNVTISNNIITDNARDGIYLNLSPNNI
ncbi:MAG: hypothetical protein DRN12_06325, partial [Thermoplasmata archaeon]